MSEQDMREIQDAVGLFVCLSEEAQDALLEVMREMVALHEKDGAA